jgi:hypothetical protein
MSPDKTRRTNGREETPLGMEHFGNMAGTGLVVLVTEKDWSPEILLSKVQVHHL